MQKTPYSDYGELRKWVWSWAVTWVSAAKQASRDPGGSLRQTGAPPAPGPGGPPESSLRCRGSRGGFQTGQQIPQQVHPRLGAQGVMTVITRDHPGARAGGGEQSEVAKGDHAIRPTMRQQHRHSLGQGAENRFGIETLARQDQPDTPIPGGVTQAGDRALQNQSGHGSPGSQLGRKNTTEGKTMGQDAPRIDLRASRHPIEPLDRILHTFRHSRSTLGTSITAILGQQHMCAESGPDLGKIARIIDQFAVAVKNDHRRRRFMAAARPQPPALDPGAVAHDMPPSLVTLGGGFSCRARPAMVGEEQVVLTPGDEGANQKIGGAGDQTPANERAKKVRELYHGSEGLAFNVVVTSRGGLMIEDPVNIASKPWMSSNLLPSCIIATAILGVGLLFRQGGDSKIDQVLQALETAVQTKDAEGKSRVERIASGFAQSAAKGLSSGMNQGREATDKTTLALLDKIVVNDVKLVGSPFKGKERVIGTVKNTSDRAIKDISLNVLFRDASGALIDVAGKFSRVEGPLRPGAELGFEVDRDIGGMQATDEELAQNRAATATVLVQSLRVVE